LLAQSGERKAQESWVHRMREIEGTRATVVFFFFFFGVFGGAKNKKEEEKSVAELEKTIETSRHLF
jgi:hypothetical protein